MTSLTPIETRYNGYHFRSRLEARVAVFFDALNIKWEYECEGFMVDGKPYLPDFWLPTFNGGMFVEVKPDGGDFSKARRLAEVLNKSMWLFEGTPTLRPYTFLLAGHHKIMAAGQKWINRYAEVSELSGVPNFLNAMNRMFQVQHYYEFERPQAFRNGLLNETYWSEDDRSYATSGDGSFRLLQQAVGCARSARFEHGQTKTQDALLADPHRDGNTELFYDDYWWGLPPYNYTPIECSTARLTKGLGNV